MSDKKHEHEEEILDEFFHGERRLEEHNGTVVDIPVGAYEKAMELAEEAGEESP